MESDIEGIEGRRGFQTEYKLHWARDFCCDGRAERVSGGGWMGRRESVVAGGWADTAGGAVVVTSESVMRDDGPPRVPRVQAELLVRLTHQV